MPTPFARDARRAASVDKVFGESFTFTAAQVALNGDVNLPKVADGSKPAFTCKGVWENFSEAMFPMGRGSNPDDEAIRRAVGQPSVLVQRDLLNWMPERGTLVTRVFDGATYQVAKALPHDRGRVIMLLSARMKA